MESSTRQGSNGHGLQQWMSDDRRRWIVGVVVAAATLSLFVVAVSCSTSSIRANNEQCLASIANDEHMALEALFQNPANQDALVQAITQCAR